MKITVVTGKDIVKYLAKIGIVFGMIAIFANFFLNNKDKVNNYFAFHSAKFLSAIKQEVLLLRESDATNYAQHKESYIASAIGSELSIFKVVTAMGFNVAESENNNNTQPTDETTQVANQDSETVQTVENSANSEETANNNYIDYSSVQEAETGVSVEVLPSEIPDKTTYQVFGVNIRNESDYNISAEISDLDVDFNKNDIIIFHTHTCESYTQTEQYQYNSSGNFRTTDLNYSVVRVGDELEKYLTNYGYSVIHDKSYHDYPSYNGSYDRSLVTVKNLLADNEKFRCSY